MDTDALVRVLLEAMTLKWMPRAGWQMRGVPNPESVAEHSFGTAFTALLLAETLSGQAGAETGLNMAVVLATAVLHDLAEARTTDLPESAARLISRSVKRQAEDTAVEQMLAPLPRAEPLRSLWLAFEDASTPEGRLVRDADKLEMMVQCLCYEQAGCRGLDEFWQAMDRHAWHYALSEQAYAHLRELHAGLNR